MLKTPVVMNIAVLKVTRMKPWVSIILL